MNKNYILILSICALFSIASASTEYYSPLLVGSIQYSGNRNNTISIGTPPPIYYSGTIVDVQSELRGFSFHIPRSHHQTLFYILVCERSSIIPVYKTDDSDNTASQTVSHFMLNAQSNYKLFQLQENVESHHWDWTQMTLEDNKIPDQTIIIFYPPEQVKTLLGGSDLAFPTIMMELDEPAMNTIESELIKTQLASLDFNTLHTAIHKTVHLDERHLRTLLVAPTL